MNSRAIFACPHVIAKRICLILVAAGTLAFAENETYGYLNIIYSSVMYCERNPLICGASQTFSIPTQT